MATLAAATHHVPAAERGGGGERLTPNIIW